MTVIREISQIKDYETLTDFIFYISLNQKKFHHKEYHKALYNNVLKTFWIDERYSRVYGIEKVFINKASGRKATKSQLQKAIKTALEETEKGLG